MVLNTLRYFFSHKESNFKRLTILLVILGFMEFFSIGLFLPLFELSPEGSLVTDLLLFPVMFFFGEANRQIIILMMLFAFSLKLGVILFYSRYLPRSINRFLVHLRVELLQQVFAASYATIQSMDMADLGNQLTKEVERVLESYHTILLILQRLSVAVAYLILSLTVSVEVSLVSLLLAGILFFSLRRVSFRSSELSQQVVSMNTRIFTQISEVIQNTGYLRATETHPHILSFLRSSFQEYAFSRRKLDTYGKMVKQAPEPVGSILVALVLLLNEFYFKMAPLAILASLVLLYKTFQSLANCQYLFQQVAALSGSVNKHRDVLQKLSRGAEQSGNVDVERVDSIELQDVSYTYSNGKGVEGVSLRLERGKVYGVIGQSGSGKTTLLNLFTGLLSPKKGQLLINETDIEKLSRPSYRRKIGYVSQNPVILQGSVEENVLGWEGRKENDLGPTLKALALDDFASVEGLKKPLSFAGSNISGGQKQRIALAREVLRRPQFMILDEGTSALDPQSEEKVSQMVEGMRGNVITVIVSHRMSALRETDEVFVMKEGRVQNRSTYRELVDLGDQAWS